MNHEQARETIRQALKDWDAATPDQKRQMRRNALRRAKNAILRELCGTSARAAREDMGI